MGEGNGGGRSSGLKNKTSCGERDADAEVGRRPDAVRGFLGSWERGGISFPRRLGSCKRRRQYDLNEARDEPSPRRRLLWSTPSALKGPADRFPWGFLLGSGWGRGTPRPTRCGDSPVVEPEKISLPAAPSPHHHTDRHRPTPPRARGVTGSAASGGG